MLDIKLIRENPELVKENIRKKFQNAKLPLVDEAIALDAEKRAAESEANELRASRNALSKKIGMLMGQAKKDPSKLAEAEEVKAQVKANADRLAQLEQMEEKLSEQLAQIMKVIPQIIDPSVPIGPNDEHNVEVQRFGECKTPAFPIPYHAEIMESFREIMDSVTATKADSFELVFDPTLVRGMSYYTGTIFEITIDGYNFSIAGGGRYDDMIGRFSGQGAPACGFSIGFERLVGALLDKKFKAEGSREKVAVLYGKAFGSGDVAALQCKCNALREAGKIVLVQKMNKNVGFQKQKLEAEGYSSFIDVRYPDEIETKL